MDDGQRKAKVQLKQLANKGETGNARILAREYVRSKKASQRLHASVAQLNSIGMQLSHQLGPWLFRALHYASVVYEAAMLRVPPLPHD